MDSSTSTSSLIQVREDGHLDVTNPSDLPYTHVKTLGMGGSAFVEMVRDTTNGQEFARKVFRKYYGPKMNEVKQNFQNEIEIIRRLSSHPHIIRVFATYT